MDFREAVIEALTHALGDDASSLDWGRFLSPPKKAEMGDLAFGCFPLAKARRMAPPQIAAEVAAAIEPTGPIGKVEAVGPYVNFFADPLASLNALTGALADGAFDASMRSGTSTRIMVEFSQPNTHKTFHVGHLRNVLLGDALVRVLSARGHDVVPVNYYGDFGIDVAKCLWWLTTQDVGTPPAEGRTAWLGAAYSQANTAITITDEDDEATQAAKHAQFKDIREVLRRMEEGEPDITQLYRETRQWCLDEFADVYRWLDVRFVHDFFESELEAPARAIVDAYLAKGTFVESEGAIICDLEDVGLVPALVRKSDGASLYMTWDLALAADKFDKFGIERSYYVVASEQNLHFQQLFATLEKMGYDRAKDCRHVSYELVMLPDGKMSSRKGTATPFHELRHGVLDAIETKMRAEARTERESWTDDQWHETARKVAIACLKYGMLRAGNTRRVIYKLEDWLNPEGDTGAYLLYSLARISGIFRKTDEAVDLATAIDAGGEFGGQAERDLLGHLGRLPDVIRRVEDTLDPSAIAQFLYDGAKKFSRFYQECPVLKADDDTRRARLALCKAAETVFTKALALLGIEPVEAM
ncbi:MAG: arginine--tRNA ligase [Planctomycetota bacterium]|nr:arginine--tRNA ligase [Planctomycetota bacterium]